ncbi:CBS domain-containing protein [Ideonella sp. A 288]|uniref:CBS domain-containing protein n=1 Tax=Ideonella sp. A 288 TaxID=1962181 RepID=UPI000B4A6E70|nr:CBS domain-containing protein [Ideonella sp. A 288]
MAERLSAGEVCTRIVSFAERGMDITEAARLMREHHVGSLVVVDETAAGRVAVGMLTDRDIVTAVVAKGVDATSLRVGDAMGPDLVSAREDDSMVDLLALMRGKGVRRVPIVGAGGVLVGLVTMDDLLGIIAEELRLVAVAIESGRHREAGQRP